MPTPEEILTGLSTIANDWRCLAIFWHAYFAVLIFGLVARLRLKKSLFGVLLAMPLLSVSVLAWFHGNPFNGFFFAFTGIILIGIATRFQEAGLGIAPMRLTIPGAGLILFGWVYPHFLNDTGPAAYLYSAPTGLVPCPTLSIAIGFTLVLRGFNSRAWCLVLGAAGLFYGALGAVRLGVMIDWILFIGALATMCLVFSSYLAGRHDGTAEKSRDTFS